MHKQYASLFFWTEICFTTNFKLRKINKQMWPICFVNIFSAVAEAFAEEISPFHLRS